MGKSIQAANDILKYIFNNTQPSYQQYLTPAGWTSTGWTGSWAGGWTNGASNTTALSNTLAAVSGNAYNIDVPVMGMTAGSFTITFGGVTTSAYNAIGYTSTLLTAVSAGTLSITPTAAFNGSIYILIDLAYLYFSLHSQDPSQGANAGLQSNYEIAYTGYNRVGVVGTTAGFTVATNTVSNATLVQFPVCTGSTATATYFAIGLANAPTTANELLVSGALANVGGLAISTGIQPSFPIGTLTQTET